MCPIPNGFQDKLFHCTDEQHAMSPHELQSALLLTMEVFQRKYSEKFAYELTLKHFNDFTDRRELLRAKQ
jgi:hypothetical protein